MLRPALPLNPRLGSENAHGSKNNCGVPSFAPGAIANVPMEHPIDPPRVRLSRSIPESTSGRFWPPLGPPVSDRERCVLVLASNGNPLFQVRMLLIHHPFANVPKVPVARDGR